MNILIVIFNTFKTEFPSEIEQNFFKKSKRGREETRREEGKEWEQKKGEGRRENGRTFWSLLAPLKPSPSESVSPG